MVRTRFAPSPTGFMHIGNLRTALYAYLYAKRNEGKFILRIEDTDQERLVDGAMEIIYSTLKSSGIIHDEGADIGGDYGPYIQSQRRDIYMEYALKLVELGGAYYCFCSKERLSSLSDSSIKKYDKHCLNLSDEEIKSRTKNGEKYVIRQNIPTCGVSSYYDLVYGEISVNCEDMEDNILIKSDGFPTYNFANVVDDHLMQISHVIRGSEYLSSTPKYNLIYDSFGWERPIYMHLPPIMKDATRKLSKRYGDANYEDFIKKGYLKDAIINYIALLGWSPKNNTEKLSLDELINMFSVDGISKSSSIFDENKLKWLNKEYIKELSIEQFNSIAEPYYEKSKVKDKYNYMLLSALLVSRVEILSEIPDMINFLEEYEKFDLKLYNHKKLKTDKTVAERAIKLLIEELRDKKAEWSHNAISDTITALADREGVKKGQLLWSMRIAITGREITPGGATEMAELLGYERTLTRLNMALDMLSLNDNI